MKLILVLLALLVLASAQLNNPFKSKEFLGALDTINRIPEHYENAARSIQDIHNIAKKAHEEIQQRFNQAVTERSARSVDTRAPPAACSTAIQALVNITTSTTCQAYVNTYFTATGTTQSSAVTGYCSNCFPSIKVQINAVLAQCNSSAGDFTPNQISGFLAYGFYNRYLCAQDQSGNYCANVIAGLSTATLSKPFTQLTTSDLNGICSTCVIKAVRILVTGSVLSNLQISTATLAYVSLRFICVQVSGQYCILTINQLTTASQKLTQDLANNNYNSNDFAAFLNIMCYPCFRAVIVRISTFAGSSSISITTFSIFGKLCRKDPSGTFCLVRLFNAIKSILPSLVAGNGAGVCSQLLVTNGTSCANQGDGNCAGTLNNLINNGGCCWALFADFSSDSGAGSSSNDPAKLQFYAAVQTCVGHSLPTPCPSYANGTLTITYYNLDYVWINNNKAAFQALVIADIGVSFGLDSYGLITIVAVGSCGGTPCKRDATNSTTTVTVNSATVPGTAAGSLTGTQVTCDSVCNQVNAQNPSGDITVSNSASNVQVVSSSSSLSVSFVLLAALFVLQFFF